MSESLRILVIDDDPVMRELLEAVLGFAGHAVESVDSGEVALEQLEHESTPPDVVLTDLHMPGLQGQELAAKLQEMREPGTLLVGMSGSYPSEEETQLLDYFLQKPFTPEQFDEALRAAREGQHGRTEPAHADGEPAVLEETVFLRLTAAIPTEQLRDLYAMTLTDVEARLKRMQAALNAGDPKAMQQEAHSIKGACGMVGASELHVLATAAEKGTDAGSARLAEFAPACERLRRMLDARLKPA